MADTLDIVNESNDLEFELDNLIISGTIDLEDYYTKEQTDSLLQENYYNKQEVDDKLSDISSGESYTQGSGINISEDNVISIDDTVALKTDLNDYQGKITNMGENLAFSTLIDTGNSLQYSNTGYFSNGSAVPFIRTLPITKGDNIDITIDNNRFKISAIVPDTSTFVTEESLNGRVIPSGSSTNFNQSGQLEIASGSQNIIYTNTNILWRNNNTTYGAIYNISSNEIGYGNSNTGINRVEYKFNDVQTQISGNTLESNLTTANALNIGKAYLCNETSTSGTYVQGHVYKIGGTNGSYTATDITPTSSVDLSDYPTNEDLEGRVIPENSRSNWNNDGTQLNVSSGHTIVYINGTNINSVRVQNNLSNNGSVDYGYRSISFGDFMQTQSTLSEFYRLDDNTIEFRNIPNSITYNLNDVQIQIGGNNLETNLTGNDTLNIGKVYTCTSDSTSGTYKAGHLYLIGGSSGAYTATDITPAGGSGGSSTTYETLTVASASWTSLSDSSPYTYQATVTLTTTLTDDSVVELLNNQAVLFATYGFAIASISGQVATIYSIGQPTENVNLTMGVTV